MTNNIGKLDITSSIIFALMVVAGCAIWLIVQDFVYLAPVLGIYAGMTYWYDLKRMIVKRDLRDDIDSIFKDCKENNVANLDDVKYMIMSKVEESLRGEDDNHHHF